MIYDFLRVERGEAPLYDSLYDNVRMAINSGRLKRGDKLPSIRELSNDIGVSRTTVSNAYDQLCAEGYISSLPKRGYFVEAEQLGGDEPTQPKSKPIPQKAQPVKWDFSGTSVDPECTDIKFWRRCVKDELELPHSITSYGLPQGELSLREALCEYSRRVRGVSATPDRIIVGAGTQALLSVLLGLCSEYGFDAAMERGFFPQGEQIFTDFRYNITPLSADKNGIILDDSVTSRILFINSSGSIRGSDPIPVNKRAEIIRWAQQRDAIIIEDDYNGELRYSSKPVPALQGLCSSRVVYIGSFSKLLLPSVRISYMVLPEKLAVLYGDRRDNYNQTSSKTEQLALAKYISCGRLDRRLRRLRKLYAERSALMCSCVKSAFPSDTVVDIIETALCVRIKLNTETPLETLRERAAANGITLGKCREKNGLKYLYLSFAGINISDIPEAVSNLASALV